MRSDYSYHISCSISQSVFSCLLLSLERLLDDVFFPLQLWSHLQIQSISCCPCTLPWTLERAGSGAKMTVTMSDWPGEACLSFSSALQLRARPHSICLLGTFSQLRGKSYPSSHIFWDDGQVKDRLSTRTFAAWNCFFSQWKMGILDLFFPYTNTSQNPQTVIRKSRYTIHSSPRPSERGFK